MLIYMKKICYLTILLFSTLVQAQTVRFETTFGNIDIELFPDDAPDTVNNFLNYVNRGDYNDTVFHRLYLLRGISIIQGGGYKYTGSGNFNAINADQPITNEASVSNTAGTIAMARTTDPDSATNQWYFNLEDNLGLNADQDNAGYAVFGKVINGIDILSFLGSVNTFNISSNIGANTLDFPTYQYYGGVVGVDNVLKIERAYVLSDEFQINAGLSGAWFNPQTDGQGLYFEVLPDAQTVIMGWYTFDEGAPDEMVPSSVGDASNRWLTAIGNFEENTFNGTIYKTSGGLFDNPQAVSTTAVGTMEIIFNNCTTAVFSYSLDDSLLSNSMNIQRISGSNVALCEELSSAANQGVAAE